MARVTLETWGKTGKLGADTVNITAGSGNGAGNHWTPFYLKIAVDSSAYTLSLTIGLIGAGTAWFDAFTLLADGQAVAEVPVAPEFSPGQMDWLTQRAAPLDILGATPKGKKNNLSGFAAFRRIAGSARIIALGESTHGTSEFFRIKHRLLEYAVKEMGATVFAIEANQLAAEEVNRYVLFGVRLRL